VFSGVGDAQFAGVDWTPAQIHLRATSDQGGPTAVRMADHSRLIDIDHPGLIARMVQKLIYARNPPSK
jgi:hypothetical protein